MYYLLPVGKRTVSLGGVTVRLGDPRIGKVVKELLENGFDYTYSTRRGGKFRINKRPKEDKCFHIRLPFRAEVYLNGTTPGTQTVVWAWVIDQAPFGC